MATQKKKTYQLNLDGLVLIFERIGVTGFVIVIGTFLLFKFGSDKQKAEVIDRLLLFKYSKDELPFAIFYFVVLLVSYLLTVSFYKSRLKIFQERIELLEKDLKLYKK